MKKILPRISTNTHGFTLVELLVVIAIIAILSMVGLTVFSGVQKNARDAKRRADIDSIASAIELKKTPGISYYDTNVVATDFGGGALPTESYTGASWGAKYSIVVYCSATAPTTGLAAVTNALTAPIDTEWGTTAPNPTVTASAGYVSMTSSAFPPGVGTTSGADPRICTSTNRLWAWKVCARLESGSGANAVYCKSYAQ